MLGEISKWWLASPLYFPILKYNYLKLKLELFFLLRKLNQRFNIFTEPELLIFRKILELETFF